MYFFVSHYYNSLRQIHCLFVLTSELLVILTKKDKKRDRGERCNEDFLNTSPYHIPAPQLAELLSFLSLPTFAPLHHLKYVIAVLSLPLYTEHVGEQIHCLVCHYILGVGRP